MNNKLLIICGPTATGKTDLAIKLAKKFNGELISADSRQVYQGMDVGTGKDLSELSISNNKFSPLRSPKANFAGQAIFKIGYYLIDGIKIWLYDIVEPNYQFNVAEYQECANLVITDILKRGKLPILVGGTGLYIKAVTQGIETIGVEPDWDLRNELSKFSVSELQNKLKELDSERLQVMNKSDINNPRRLIRAIEIAKKCKVQSAKCKVKNVATDNLFIGLTASYDLLYQMIDQRVEQRIKDGVENEVENLIKAGYFFNNSVLGSTIGYQEWKASEVRERIIQQWKFNEHAYCRRQITWFKKEKMINWYDIEISGWQSRIEELINKWLNKKTE